MGRNGGSGGGDGGGKGNKAPGAWTPQADYGPGGWAKQPGAGGRPGRWAETSHTAGELGTAAARLAPAPPGTELGATSTRLGPPKQRLEPADALRQGRPGRQQEPSGQRPVFGPGATWTPWQSGSLAGHPGRDGCGVCGFGHRPRAPLSACAGPGLCTRVIAGDRFGQRRTRLVRRCARLAARGFA